MSTNEMTISCSRLNVGDTSKLYGTVFAIRNYSIARGTYHREITFFGGAVIHRNCDESIQVVR